MVEHKTGTLNGYTGDVGFVTRPDGRRLAVVFFARGGDNRPAVISTAARAVYDGFGGEGQREADGLAAPLGGRVTQASTWQSGQPGRAQAATGRALADMHPAGQRLRRSLLRHEIPLSAFCRLGLACRSWFDAGPPVPGSSACFVSPGDSCVP